MEKSQRPFRNPGDVLRALQRISRRGPDWANASPIEIASFLSACTPVPAIYDVVADRPLAGYSQIDFMPYGANLPGDTDSTMTADPIDRFWSSPIFAEAKRTPAPASYDPELLRGWHFIADNIGFTFYDSAYARYSHEIRELRCTAADIGFSTGAFGGGVGQAEFERGIPLGYPCNFTNRDTQFFSRRCSGDGNTTSQSAGHLLEVPMIGNARLLCYWSTVAATGKLRAIISGKWHFNPYMIEQGEELKG